MILALVAKRREAISSTAIAHSQRSNTSICSFSSTFRCILIKFGPLVKLPKRDMYCGYEWSSRQSASRLRTSQDSAADALFAITFASVMGLVDPACRLLFTNTSSPCMPSEFSPRFVDESSTSFIKFKKLFIWVACFVYTVWVQ